MEHNFSQRFWFRAIALVFAIISLKSAVAVSAAAVSPWPVPLKIVNSGNALTIGRNFKVVASTNISAASMLARVTARYQKLIRSQTQSLVLASALSQVSVDVAAPADEHLGRSTNETYTIKVSSTASGQSSAIISAPSVFGAMRGLETFAQLAELGGITSHLQVTDGPSWRHRGLMVDTARRFVPPALLRTIIDGMSFSKLNVLHLHLSDEPAVRFQSKKYPQLTAHLPAGTFYTQADLSALVAYAKDRGVRIIPEIDLPGHTGGFRALGQLVKYCDQKQSVLANQPQNIKVVKELLGELSSVFIDDVIHFGGDEVCKHDVCPQGCDFAEVQAFEKAVQRAITGLDRRPMSWNDVFSDPVASQPNAALPGTIIQNWRKQPLQTFAKLGFTSLDSQYTTMYLGQPCCSAFPNATNNEKLCYYRNSGESLVGTPLQSLMEGGEVAIWNDNYCPSPECSINGTYGWMYPKAMDKVFSESFGNMIFPDAAGAAGSLWNYVAALAPGGVPTDAYNAALQHHVLRLQRRSVYACDNDCTCDWGSKCVGSPDAYYGGHPTPYNVEIKLINGNCPYNVHIKKRVPCIHKSGADLASLHLHDQATIRGSDFIAEAVVRGEVKVGDPFSAWIGDATWINVKMTLNISCDSSDYITYTQVMSEG